MLPGDAPADTLALADPPKAPEADDEWGVGLGWEGAGCKGERCSVRGRKIQALEFTDWRISGREGKWTRRLHALH